MRLPRFPVLVLCLVAASALAPAAARARKPVLDEGPGMDGDSLAANPTRLYWMRDGVPNTASFH
jgi:hypothetical protein